MEGNSGTTRGDLDRRTLMRRAAVLGAATAWAAPTVQSIAGPAFAAGSPQGGCVARMTGGGRVDSTPGSLVMFNGLEIPFLTFGLGNIICGPNPDDTQIEINAHSQGRQRADHSFHFTIAYITCSKEAPNPAPGPNTALCANVFSGTAVDGYGNSLSFRLADHGEGHNMDLDMATFQITGSSTLTAAGNLDRGNLQVHDNVPHVERDCSGC